MPEAENIKDGQNFYKTIALQIVPDRILPRKKSHEPSVIWIIEKICQVLAGMFQ